MESIIDYLKRKLKDAGPGTWPAIAGIISTELPEDEKISEHFLRKLAYGDRDNPGLKVIQPLLDFFRAVERGEKVIPAKQDAPAIDAGTDQLAAPMTTERRKHNRESAGADGLQLVDRRAKALTPS